VALPPPYTAETVNEWAESFFDSFLAEETANRIKAEEEAAVREAKRLKERNAAKVKPLVQYYVALFLCFSN
jgi:hypothetical protein